MAYEDEGEEEATDRFAFVPFLDMANEDADAPTAAYVVAGDAFELRATTPLAVGDAVTVAYAAGRPRSPRAHFALYGFVRDRDLAAALGVAGPPPCDGLADVDCRVAEYAAVAAALGEPPDL